jgi:hypothetical protein
MSATARITLAITALAAAIAIGGVLALTSKVSNQNRVISQLQQQTQSLERQASNETSQISRIRVSAIDSHLGVCVALDNATGDISTVATPMDTGGVPSCITGLFTPVVPGAGQ